MYCAAKSQVRKAANLSVDMSRVGSGNLNKKFILPRKNSNNMLYKNAMVGYQTPHKTRLAGNRPSCTGRCCLCLERTTTIRHVCVVPVSFL